MLAYLKFYSFLFIFGLLFFYSAQSYAEIDKSAVRLSFEKVLSKDAATDDKNEDIKDLNKEADHHPENETYILDYWSTSEPNIALFAIEASEEKIDLPDETPFEGKTAVLILLDTSNPARRGSVAKQLESIRNLKTYRDERNALALATFDKELQIRNDFDADPKIWDEHLSKIDAEGLTTELWRNILQGLKILEQQPAARKALIVFTDGMAEDTAYKLEDVVKQANLFNIPIYGYGYPARVTDTVALQGLRRVTEETGGLYYEADTNGQLEQKNIEMPFSALQSGGMVELDAGMLKKAAAAGSQNIVFIFSADQDNTQDIRIEQAFDAGVQTAPAQNKDGIISKNSNESKKTADLVPATLRPLIEAPWIMAVGGGTLLLLLFLLTIKHKKTTGQTNPSGKPFAYLRIMDHSAPPLPVMGRAVRIGRNKDNDLVLDNESVSGFHADLHLMRDEVFAITDLNSLNGTQVNGESIQSGPVYPDDVITLGEVRIMLLRA